MYIAIFYSQSRGDPRGLQSSRFIKLHSSPLRLTIIVNNVACFLWQDNNAVLGITTAFPLHATVLRERKRPSLTSRNARIVRPVFGDAVKKWLYILTCIDKYNYYMNGVDRNN
jgi:hypothetical protein